MDLDELLDFINNPNAGETKVHSTINFFAKLQISNNNKIYDLYFTKLK